MFTGLLGRPTRSLPFFSLLVFTLACVYGVTIYAAQRPVDAWPEGTSPITVQAEPPKEWQTK